MTKPKFYIDQVVITTDSLNESKPPRMHKITAAEVAADGKWVYSQLTRTIEGDTLTVFGEESVVAYMKDGNWVDVNPEVSSRIRW